MELTPKQQTIELLKQAKNILILAHKNPDGDALGSLVALTLALKKLDKNPTPVSLDTPPQFLEFLPSLNLIQKHIHQSNDLTLHLDVSKVQIKNLGYKQLPDEQKVAIVISPKAGRFDKQDISFPEAKPSYDLVVVLDTPDLPRLGKIADQFADTFYDIPVINIDHHPGNDYFGKVNWIDLTATSTAEILVALFESLGAGKSLLDADIATCLLTGITTDTASFQNANTTPKSFTVAAQLVAAGARQQEIIRHIYKTKPLSTLKLWGQALSHIQENEAGNFIYSTLTEEDFAAAGASEHESSGVIDDLLKTADGKRFVMLASEKRGGLHVSLRALEKGINLTDLANLFGGGGHDLAAAFEIPNGTVKNNLPGVLGKISSYLQDREKVEAVKR
jgi:bifunctional oligoribonuclease and PAP phosphatase NrnA